MRIIIQVLIILILLAVFIQDIRSRAVYWLWFPLLTGLFLVDTFQIRPFLEILNSSLFNIGFVTLQLLFVSLYFSIKHKQMVNITKNLLGWGDILFLLSIAFYFSILNYILFYVLSLVVVLLFWGISVILFRKKQEQIPLAGLQSIIFIVCLGVDWLCPQVDLIHDDWLLRYLS